MATDLAPLAALAQRVDTPLGKAIAEAVTERCDLCRGVGGFGEGDATCDLCRGTGRVPRDPATALEPLLEALPYPFRVEKLRDGGYAAYVGRMDGADDVLLEAVIAAVTAALEAADHLRPYLFKRMGEKSICEECAVDEGAEHDIECNVGMFFRALDATAASGGEGEAVLSENTMLKEALAELSACTCGCPLGDHENYGEDGISCDVESHECFPCYPAVAEMIRQLQAAHPPTPLTLSREEAEEVRKTLLWSLDLLEYFASTGCECEPCPECGEAPKDCSGTDCAQMCSCRECDDCTYEMLKAAVNKADAILAAQGLGQPKTEDPAP